MSKQLNNVKNAKRPLRVGFVFDDSLDSFDGVAQQVKGLGQWLSSRGHIVSYLVGETKMRTWTGGSVYSLAKNQKVSFNKNTLSIPFPANKKAIRKILAEENYDVLHVQMPHSPLMAGRVLSLANTKTAVLGTFHILPAGKMAMLGSYILKRLYGRGLKRFDKVFSVSPAAAQFAENVFGIESEVLPNVVDIKKFSGAKKAKKQTPEIIFLGRLVKRKGCFELLKAFELAKRQGLDAKLVIAGQGPDRKKLESYVKQKKLSESVEFLGFINEADKPSLLARADIACFPAIGGESFGIVLIEAMAAGARVVLGGDNPGYRSVLGGNPALLINSSETQIFAERLKLLLDDRTLITDIECWLQSEVKKYDVSVVGKQLELSYVAAIAKRTKNIHNVANEAG